MKCGVCKKHQVIRVAANVRGKDSRTGYNSGRNLINKEDRE